MASSKRVRGSLAVAGALVALVNFSSPSATIAAPPPVPSNVDLSTYVRVGRFDLPEPTRTMAPAGSLLCQECSAVTYDWDTDTLFIVGDGGTSIVQVTKTGQLVNSMSLATGSSPQGTEFYDPEGLTYVGGGKFVMAEERYRQVNLLTYAAGTTLTRAAVQTVKLGTTLGNVGIEGISADPLTNGLTPGFIAVKETSPQGIFQTNVDFVAGTATNGSPATVNSTNLFDPLLMGLNDIADVFALSNLPAFAGTAEASRLLVLSQESGKIVNVDRSGSVSSTLTIVADVGNPLSVPGHGFEGVTMDRDGKLYIVGENAGGDSNHPQLWVYAPSTGVNQAPTGLTLANAVTQIVENTSTATRLKVADVVVADDGLGQNDLSLTGADVAFLEVDSTGLYIKAATTLDFETKTSYSVTVVVNDLTAGATPDATVPYSLAVVNVVDETTQLPRLIISEVAPWGSGNAPYAADWIEITNTGATAANIAGWKIDDSSNGTVQIALNGVASIAPGQSVIFLETTSAVPATVANTINLFKTAWFGTNVPAGFTIGWYSGSGIGLSTTADAVNLFDAAGTRITGVQFGLSATGPFASFDNTAGQGSATLPLPSIATLSMVNVNGAFKAVNDLMEIGSPGRIANIAPVANAGPDQLTVEATGPAGALVSLDGSGSFDANGDILTYAWSEGGSPLANGVTPLANLGLGARTVTLTADDGVGGSGMDTVAITVRDTTGPAITGNPDGMTVEATSAAGAVVMFIAPTAFDLVDGVVAVGCALPSGAVFPIGTTLNLCTAMDSRGNTSASSFRVTVRDTTAPVLSLPADIVVPATSPVGAVVAYEASAADLVGVATFTCVPASGTTFAVGMTTVTCTATDTAGNSASASFSVTVSGVATQLANLLDELESAMADRKHDDHAIDEAAKHLEKGLSQVTFLDEMHLAGRPDKGEKLFHELHDVADHLAHLLKDKHSSFDDATLREWIETAVGAARILAATSVLDGARFASAKDLAKAQDQLAKGAAEAAALHFPQAVDRYREAWKTIMK